MQLYEKTCYNCKEPFKTDEIVTVVNKLWINDDGVVFLNEPGGAFNKYAHLNCLEAHLNGLEKEETDASPT